MHDILLDSDVIIEILRGNEAVAEEVIGLGKAGRAVLYTPISKAEIYHGIRDSEKETTEAFFACCRPVPITDEIGEKAGRVVGFALGLPDINIALKHAGGSLLPTGLLKILYYQRLVKDIRVLALGVVEEYRASGLAAAFYATLWRNAKRLGFGRSEMSWILEDNVLMNRSLIAMGAKRYKTYRIYEWN